jgi:ubiquinone/menaquinone biosynthesis C-methylase UbiE
MSMVDKAHSLYDFGSMAHKYDRWYETPEGRSHDRQQKSAVRRLLAKVAPGDRLLDVGCGTGHWSCFFASLGFSVFGIDISPRMIEKARSHNWPGCRFEVADAEHLLSTDRSFEVVAAMFTLEFVADPAEVLAEMCRCVKPGGRLIVGTLNKSDPLNCRRIARGEEPYASSRMFSPPELNQLLARHGKVRMSASLEAGRHHKTESVPEENRSDAFIIAEVRP